MPPKLLALVVSQHDDWQVGRRIERLLDALQDQRAERIGDVRNHDADGVTSAAAQRASGGVWTVAKFARDSADMLFGAGGDITGEWRFVEHEGDSRGGESTGARNIGEGDAFRVVVLSWQTARP